MAAPSSTPADHAKRNAGASNSRPFAGVTGGSEGIGLALAERLVARGTSVLLVARRAKVLAAAQVNVLRDARDGARVELLAVDITDPEAPFRIEQALAAAGGHLELLVNAAGIGLA